MSILKFLKLYPYQKWEVKSPNHYNKEEVTFEGNGFVLLGDVRYDDYEFFFKEERDLWNCIKKSATRAYKVE